MGEIADELRRQEQRDDYLTPPDVFQSGSIAEDLRSLDDRDREFRLNTANSLQIEPEVADRIFAVAAQTLLPEEVVAADLPNLEKQLKLNQFNPDDYKDENNGAPAFNAFAKKNPYHLSVLERDRKNMTRLERAVHALDLSWDAGFATTEIAEIENRNEGKTMPPEDAERLKELNALLSGGHFGVDNKAARFITGAAKQTPIMGWILKESLDEAAAGMALGVAVGSQYGGAGGTFVAPGLGTVTGTAAGGAGGGLIGLVAGFWYGKTDASGRLEKGLFLNEARQLGLNQQQAEVAARVHYVVGGLAESIGFGALTKRLPGFRQIQKDVAGQVISRVFSKPSAKHAVGRLMAGYGEALGTEIITEMVQESSNMILMDYLKSQARDAGDDRPEVQPMQPGEFVDRIAQTIEETIYGAGLIAGVGPISQFYRESKQAYQAERLQHVWKAMGEATQDNQLRETAANKYEEFVDILSEYGKRKEVMIDAKQMDTYFQEQGIDPDEVYKSLGMKEQDVADAREMQGALEIPMKSYLTVLAPTEHHKALTPHLKTETIRSLSETRLLAQNNPELVEQMERLLSGEEKIDRGTDAQIQQDLTGQLVASGLSPEAAATSAKQFSEFFITLASEYDSVDPKELMGRFFSKVVSVDSAVLDKPQFDIDLDPYIDMLRDPDKALIKKKEKLARGVTLMDYLKQKGGLVDEGGELSARDLQLEMPNIVTKGGMAMDHAAELAYEAGYIAERDIGVLQEALDNESAGKAGPGKGADMRAVEELAYLEALEQALDVLGLDLDTKSNKEIKKTLDAMETMYQEGDVDTQASAIAEILVSEIEEVQDFGDLTLTETMRIQETGKDVKVTQPASTLYRRAVKRRNVVKKLMDCVSG